MAYPKRENQQLIDDEIQRLERHVVELKRQRNELSPVSILPPEIHCHILLLATSFARHPHDYNELPEKLRSDRCIRTLCHVSHSWRLITLGCPQLWAEIDIGNSTDSRRVDFMLQHAHPHPISFLIRNYFHPNVFVAVKQVLWEGHDLNRLMISGNPSIVNKLLEVAQPRTLQALEIAVIGTHIHDYTATGLKFIQHPLFARETPGLRSISINGFSIPLTSLIFTQSPQLTTLSLPVQDGSRLSHILDILGNTPLLQCLCLDFLGHLQLPPTTLHPVRLSHLLHAVLNGDSISVTAVLSYLRAPRMGLRLGTACDVRDVLNSRQEGANFFRALGEARRSPSEHLFSPHNLGVFLLPTDREGVSRMRFGSWNAGTDPVVDPENAAVVAVFQREGTRSGLDPERWNPLMYVQHPKDLPQLIGWSMDELSAFGIHDDSVYPDSLWRLLSQCPKLSELSVHIRQAPTLLPLLSADNGVLAFPSLRCLNVSSGGEVLYVRDDHYEAFFESLLRSSEDRQVILGKHGVETTWVFDKLVLGFHHRETESFAHTVKDRGLIREVIS
ncbi:hypothetical protein NMY22_g15810 [Coprinellus aureogranulatus]|nr:hypothetical protein NMY22_g15810 [Coprinellus aureogranulatus]